MYLFVMDFTVMFIVLQHFVWAVKTVNQFPRVVCPKITMEGFNPTCMIKKVKGIANRVDC